MRLCWLFVRFEVEGEVQRQRDTFLEVTLELNHAKKIRAAASPSRRKGPHRQGVVIYLENELHDSLLLSRCNIEDMEILTLL